MSDEYAIWVCLDCGKQARGPGGHHVVGDDACSGVHRYGPDREDEVVQPRLARVAVEVKDAGTRAHLFRARRREQRRTARRREETQPEQPSTEA
jgi:hypothetical protein